MEREQKVTNVQAADANRLRETGGRLSGLELRARQIVDGFLAGSHRGPRRGSSAEFAEHREYSPGDDLRYLDWKVYGKHDRFYLKQLEQETNFTCHLLLDVSDSMRYRSDGAALSKLDAASLAAAAMAWLVLRQQDLVGLTTLAESPSTVAPPSGQTSHFHHITNALEAICARLPELPEERGGPQAAPHAIQCIHKWVEQGQRRSVVVVLSDCFGDFEETMRALRHVRSRRHDVLLLQVIDPAEQDFPFDEPTLFHDVESPRSQSVDCRQLRAAYCAEFESFRSRLEAESRELGVDYSLMRTDEPIERSLAAFLSRRARRGAST